MVRAAGVARADRPSHAIGRNARVRPGAPNSNPRPSATSGARPDSPGKGGRRASGGGLEKRTARCEVELAERIGLRLASRLNLVLQYYKLRLTL